jgi:glycosyltransferase involved in cell wall biosynthesis
MKYIRISVIIPVYNIQEYLPMCLDSCQRQSYDNVEFICVNDGSTDSSPKIAGRYAAQNGRFKVIHKENGGLSSARNAGLEAATGNWVMFLDGDDCLKDGAVETLAKVIEDSRGAEIIIFSADTFPSSIDEEKWFKKTLQFESVFYDSFSPKVLFEERGAMPFVWRHAYCAALLARSGVRFDEGVRYGEDVIFPMSIFPQAEGFAFTDKCLYNYRLNREGSLTGNIFADADRVVWNHIETIRHVADFWQEKGWINKYGEHFLFWTMKFVILKIRKLKGAQRKARTKEFFDDIIFGYGLEKYRRKLNLTGMAMWLCLVIMKG